MYFNYLFALIVICLSIPVDAVQAAAPVTHLSVKPNKCVALRQGRTCFADVTLTWQVAVAGDYCLLSNKQQKPLACWQNKRFGSVSYNFESHDNEQFTLVSRHNSTVLLASDIQVTWLHKSSSKKRRWRLF